MQSLWRAMALAWLGGPASPALTQGAIRISRRMAYPAAEAPICYVLYRDGSNRLSVHRDEMMAIMAALRLPNDQLKNARSALSAARPPRSSEVRK
jgi:hypothetical protein